MTTSAVNTGTPSYSKCCGGVMWSMSFATLFLRCMELKSLTTKITDSCIFSEAVITM